MLMFGEDMSIFARSTHDPSSSSPFLIFSNSARLSATGRSRYGLLRPASVSVPRCARIASDDSSSTYARPRSISETAWA